MISRDAFALALIALVPLLLPFSRMAELPIMLGALVGVYALVQNGRQLWNDAPARALGFALGLYSFAALISAIDAVDPEKSWTTAIASLRLGLYALAVRWLLMGARSHRLMALAAALPIALWTLDGAAQALTGYSLGGPLDADRLSGIFGADDLKLGPLLPALAPLLLWPLLDRCIAAPTAGRIAFLMSVYLLLALVVLLAGARAGWVSFALATMLMALRLAQHSMRLTVWIAAGALVVVGAISGIAYQQSEHFRARVDRTLEFRSGNADHALAGRLPIWRTAGAMIAAHPVNGVGVRSFRFAYPDFAATDDPWVDPSGTHGAAHAHQILLELLSETGVIGLCCWLLAGWSLWRLRRGALPGAAAALLVLTFPLNTHLAFYSSFMGIVLAWLVALQGVREGPR